MILKKIEVENFRQLTGANEIRFSCDRDSPVTLLIGENGAGKTTLLHAFLWCLYGKTDFENPDEVVSYKAIEDAPMDSQVNARVAVTFEARGRTYYAQRRTAVKKQAGGRTDPVQLDPDFYVLCQKGDGESLPEKEPSATIEQLLPKDLSGFFFFRGEDLEDLVAQRGSERLKEAVRKFVNLGPMEKAVDHLKRVRKDLEKKIQGSSEGKVQEYSRRISETEEELERLGSHRENLSREYDQIENQRESVWDSFEEFRRLEPIVGKKRALDERLTNLRSQIKDREQLLARCVSRDGYLTFQSGLFENVQRLADEAVDSGDLPANIKPHFVEALLEKGTCICGRPLDEVSTGALGEWKTCSRLGYLESAISVLRSEVTNLLNRSSQFAQDFDKNRVELAELESRWGQALGELNECKSELTGRNFDDTMISGLQTTMKSLDEEKGRINLERGRLDKEIDDLSKELKELNADREAHVSQEGEARRLVARIRAIQSVQGALERLRDGWIRIVQTYLDEQLKRKWAEMAQLERLVEFNERFLLKIKERGSDDTWKVSAPSSANKRALALSFVAALIQLAADAAESKGEEARLNWFPGGEYPLVMDAPFATMDAHFKQTVPKGLRSVIPQIVLISSHDQWKGEVESELGNSVGEAYVLELHGGRIARTISYHDREVDYVVREHGTAYDWTQIKGVD